MLKRYNLPDLERAELLKLAEAFANNQVFTDLHIPENDLRLLASIFMPFMFMNFEEYEPEDLKQIGMIYEYLDKAGPRSINGYPMFMSMRMLNKNDLKRMFEIAEKLNAAKKKVMEEIDGQEGTDKPTGDSSGSIGGGGVESSPT